MAANLAIRLLWVGSTAKFKQYFPRQLSIILQGLMKSAWYYFA